MSGLHPGPQLFKYFIAHAFPKQACSPSWRLGFLLDLLSGTPPGLGGCAFPGYEIIAAPTCVSVADIQS